MLRAYRLLGLILILAAVGMAQIATPVAPPVNAIAAAAAGPAGAVTNPSGLVANVAPGPIYCQGSEQFLHTTQFTLPASATSYIYYDCNASSVVATSATPPIGSMFVPLAAVAAGTSTLSTITDERPASAFPVVNDWYEFVPAIGACASSVSGNSSGTNGATVAGASNVAVVQASTSATGTNTHIYQCHIPLPSRTTAGKGVTGVSDIVFLYGVQTSALGTQSAANFAAGSITYPAAAASETASTVAPASAGGTVTLTPAAASMNTATTTAGAFYSQKIAFGTPLVLNTDLVENEFTVTLQAAATSATVTNTPGFFVHYTFLPN